MLKKTDAKSRSEKRKLVKNLLMRTQLERQEDKNRNMKSGKKSFLG